MKKNILYLIIYITIFSMISIFCISNVPQIGKYKISPSYLKFEGAKVQKLSADEIIKKSKNFINNSNEVDLIAEEDTIIIGQFLFSIGIVVIIIVILIMGIKYILATPDNAAKLKKNLFGIVLAAVVIFCSFTIWSLVIKILENTGL